MKSLVILDKIGEDNNKMVKIILFGPQGSGKGTQAELIEKEFGIPPVSTGNILRDNINRGTELGKTAKDYIVKGHLVPDSIILGIIENRLKEKDTKNGFLLDGFPRNKVQAEGLAKITDVDAVIEIDVSDKESIKRISGRRTCKCGAVYHVFYNPPRILEICDKCGSKLFQREDDKEDAIRKRLEIYHSETKPVISFYGEKSIKINGEQSIEKVFENILSELKKRNPTK